MKDGTRLDEQHDAPRAFASDGDIINKFRNLASHRFDSKRVDRLVELVMGLDSLPNLGPMLNTLYL